ncbi:MAG: XdhC family protein, partial [Pseudomonadota bacterium]
GSRCSSAAHAFDRIARSGFGSPYMDIQLPCGGALEITLIPNPDRAILSNACAALLQRDPAHVFVDVDTASLAETVAETTLQITYEPDIHFTVLGKGPEATVFTALARAAGFPADMWSPDAYDEHRLQKNVFPESAVADQWAAIVLFFHDHDWEPALLEAALKTDAFYIGAQGSKRARATRDAILSAKGITGEHIARINGPIGLIPSARDPQTLAVSVLADVLATFKARQ